MTGGYNTTIRGIYSYLYILGTDQLILTVMSSSKVFHQSASSDNVISSFNCLPMITTSSFILVFLGTTTIVKFIVTFPTTGHLFPPTSTYGCASLRRRPI